MGTLHILKSEPDGITLELIRSLSEDEDATLFRLYEDKCDYEAFLDILFEHEKVICWW